MRRALLSAVAAGLSAAALLTTGIAAASISPSYSVNGIGSAVSTLEFRLVGNGAGSTGGRLSWKAALDHDLLSSDPASPASVTGGTVNVTAHGGGPSDQLDGVFTGGTITFDPALSSTRPCGDQVYDVDATAQFDGWTGELTVRLTQSRVGIAGRCFSLTTRVSGDPGLTLTPTPVDPPPATPPPGGGEF